MCYTWGSWHWGILSATYCLQRHRLRKEKPHHNWHPEQRLQHTRELQACLYLQIVLYFSGILLVQCRAPESLNSSEGAASLGCHRAHLEKERCPPAQQWANDAPKDVPCRYPNGCELHSTAAAQEKFHLNS